MSIKPRNFKILASPHLRTVAVGETVEYRLLALDPTSHNEVRWDSTDNPNISWLLLNESNTGQPGSEGLIRFEIGCCFEHQFTEPGKYIVAAQNRVPDSTPFGTFEVTEYPQSVQDSEAFLHEPLSGRLTHTLDPESVLSGLQRYRLVLDFLEKEDFQNPAILQGVEAEQYKKHRELVRAFGSYISALERRLESTSPRPLQSESEPLVLKIMSEILGDPPFERPASSHPEQAIRVRDWFRRPITAWHTMAETGEEFELKIFLAQYGLFQAERLFPQASTSKARWKLVDWTNAADRGRTGEYDGEGETDLDAVKACIQAWSKANRYWHGKITWEVPRGVCCDHSLTSWFPTNGSTFWDNISEFLAWVSFGALAVTGIILLLSPVPGSQLASMAIWTSLAGAIAGFSAAAINIGQRHAEGFGNWKEDGVDALTIVGCLFGLGGVWARGAKVLIPMGSGVSKFIFVGNVTTMGAQGVLMTEDTYDRYREYRDDSTLLPTEKLDKMMVLIGNVALQSALLYVNLKASGGELEFFNEVQPRGRSGKIPPSPSERLQALGNPDKEFDTTEIGKLVGHTDEGQHRTVVREEMHRNPVPGLKPPTRPMGRPSQVKVLIVGAETEQEFAYALNVNKLGGEAIAVNPVRTEAATIFERRGGKFIENRIESLPAQREFDIIREDYPYPRGDNYVDAQTVRSVDARLSRLKPEGYWLFLTEKEDYADTIEAVSRMRGASVERRELPPFHELIPLSEHPRDSARFLLIITND